MKNLIIALATLSFFTAVSVLAAPKTYQVTGPVIDVNDSTITVQKGKEKWEIAREASTETKGEIKKGDKVTVEYRMTAAAISAKPAKAK